MHGFDSPCCPNRCAHPGRRGKAGSLHLQSPPRGLFPPARTVKVPHPGIGWIDRSHGRAELEGRARWNATRMWQGPAARAEVHGLNGPLAC